jgi:hypothetical protein
VLQNHKLSYKYFVPFEILQKVGAMAYKLKLSDSTSIHTVVEHRFELADGPALRPDGPRSG